MSGILIDLYAVPKGKTYDAPQVLVGQIRAKLPGIIDTIVWNNQWFQYTGKKAKGRRRFERVYPACAMILTDSHISQPGDA